MPTPFRLLFVCLGNICRSPAAEGIMQGLVKRAELDLEVSIDSAGTAGWHAGKPADPRMREAAQRRGFPLSSLARQVTAADYQQFDLILAMDHANRSDLETLFSLKAGRSPSEVPGDKLRLFGEFCTRHTLSEVPDPYYDGAEGFERVLDILEDGCAGVLDHVRARLQR